METTVTDAKQAYLQAVEALLGGDGATAIRLLAPLVGPETPQEVRLALGKAYLMAGQGAEAIQMLATCEPQGPTARAYVELLRAAAEAKAGRPDEAKARLEAIPGLEPRFEHAARQLQRRIENDRPPAIRF
ncbi:MAG: hypothetical protein KC645_08660 [Gemmatimonadetes bacterium]|nr:hypothetical protein [Gemmatimonadota bacterium]